MESNVANKTGAVGISTDDIESQGAVNSLILDYYKKFGKKRDLEQFFSLSTSESDIRDTSGSFWRKMKSENDSSDSGEHRNVSVAHELCRISIRCTMPDPSSSQSDDTKTKSVSPETVSPPIIIEEPPSDTFQQSDDESFKSEDNHSQKSFDPLLDLSGHKLLSPTSSITSQRKLEWDSLADVGYGNESERKTSGSSLSTLERLALKQQYSNNDSKQDIGHPTSHSTPLDENGDKSKTKKNSVRKVTKISKKDIDFVEVNVPHASVTSTPQSIQVNLTKHISFNVEKDGGITIDNTQRNVNITPEKEILEATDSSQLAMDKEIQTSLPKKKNILIEDDKSVNINSQKVPVIISLNTLRKRLRRRKSVINRKKLKTKRRIKNIKEKSFPEKSREQLSEAESFEYMPGHIYNQNQLKTNESNVPRPVQHSNSIGNKSSLESSGGLTTDSSNGSKHSLTKDLEKCIEVLKLTLQNRYDDRETKKTLIKDIVQRLLNSKYRDDDTTTDFLSGLSFNSKKIGLKGNNTTTSTSDMNNTDGSKGERSRKSILRTDKFDSKIVASTSQSAPNLLTAAASSEKINSKSFKRVVSNPVSDESSRGKTSSDNALSKTSSEELYFKYLEALKREESYKRRLKENEMFLKQKLGHSKTVEKIHNYDDFYMNKKLKDLMKDLTRKDCDDGSGDASKFEDRSVYDRNIEKCNELDRRQRSHSVFTLSSSHTESQRRQNTNKKMQVDRDNDVGTSKKHYCCCPHHNINSKLGYSDSSVQVNIKYQYEDEDNGTQNAVKLNKCPHCQMCESDIPKLGLENLATKTRVQYQECPNHEKPSQTDRTLVTNCPKDCQVTRYLTSSDQGSEICGPFGNVRNIAKVTPDKTTEEIKYVCLCKNKPVPTNTEEFLIYKCCKFTDRVVELEDGNVTNANVSCVGSCKSSKLDEVQLIQAPCQMDNASNSTNSCNKSNTRRHSRSSQTNLVRDMLTKKSNGGSTDSEPINLYGSSTRCVIGSEVGKQRILIHEATRCLQTEISIDPKIADPSLSDITIVTSCAELVREESREVVTNVIDDIKTFSDVYTSSDSGKLLLKSEDSNFQGDIKDSDLNIIESKNSNIRQLNVSPKEYTIPIKGTDMTLMVNLTSSDTKRDRERIDQRVGTETVHIMENGTSIDTECAKSVQCQFSTPANGCNNNTTSSVNHSSNKRTKNTRTSRAKNSSLNGNSLQCNTYPKVLQLKVKSPLRRASTDIGKSIGPFVQTNSIHDISLLATESNATDSTPKSKTSDKYMDRLLLRTDITNEEGLLKDTKEIGVQKDLIDDETNQKKLSPEMISKSVGDEMEILDKQIEVGCQTNLETQYQKNTPLNNSFNFQSTCEVSDKITKKKLCGTCGCVDVCRCEIKRQKNESISKKDTIERSERESSSQSGPNSESNILKDPIMTVIQDITRRYSKGDITKIKKKKCFSEIVTVLNYLLETEDSTDQELKSVGITPASSDNCCKKILGIKIANYGKDNTRRKESKKPCDTKFLKPESTINCDEINKAVLRTPESETLPSKLDKSIQLSSKSTSKCTESSDLPISTDHPSTSDSTACKILNKIKKECEKYHLRRKCGRKCEISSSTSVNCDDCKKVHHCGCRHKCKRSKMVDKVQKKCFAYNLILQTSESMLSEETVCDNNRPLPNIVIKVPKRKDKVRTETCKETIYRIEKGLKSNCNPGNKRSSSCPKDSEVSSNDDFVKRTEQCTVREYLEKNRPDFVERSGERRNCLKFINEMRANERTTHRDLLSLYVERKPDLTSLTSEQLRDLAKQIGLDMRRKKPPPKLMSEREMKKHSKNIYKTLPEVVQKKEDKKKDNVKKTNLLMANMFKKNLQKKTLCGSVNLSNYSTVIKI